MTPIGVEADSVPDCPVPGAVRRPIPPEQVTLHLNSNPEPLPFVMKVGNEGEAFFVFETDADDPNIPPEMVTSPVLSAASSPLLPPVPSEDITFVPPADGRGEYEDEVTPHHSRAASLDDLDLGEAQGRPLDPDPLDAQLEEFVVQNHSNRHDRNHKKRRDRFNRITSEHGERTCISPSLSRTALPCTSSELA